MLGVVAASPVGVVAVNAALWAILRAVAPATIGIGSPGLILFGGPELRCRQDSKACLTANSFLASGTPTMDSGSRTRLMALSTIRVAVSSSIPPFA